MNNLNHSTHGLVVSNVTVEASDNSNLNEYVNDAVMNDLSMLIQSIEASDKWNFVYWLTATGVGLS